MKYIAAILILSAGLFHVLPAVAGDLVVSRGVLEDKTATMTISDVVKREFKPVNPMLSKGFSKSAYWLRLQVRAPSQGSRAVLFIRQPFLNEIRLYEAGTTDPATWKTRVTGNYYPYSERERHRNTLGFNVNIADSEAIYYLRLKTSTVNQLTVEALEPTEAERMDTKFDLLEVFFATAMILLLLWAIHSYLLDRLAIVGLFAIHQALYTLYGIAITGYLAPFIPDYAPHLADLATAIPYCGVCFTTLLFCRTLFKPYDPPPLLMQGLNLFLLVFPIQLAAMALGYIPFAVIVNAILIKFSWWYFVIMTFTLRREQSPSRRLLQLFFVIITLVFTIFWFSGRITPAGTSINIGRQILIANGLIIGGLFAMILNARSRRLQQEAHQSAMELQAKSEFLALVSHEIRTPLNALVGFSSMARKATDPLKIDQYLAILESSSRSLMELVNGILDMSKIEAGRMEFENMPINLRQLVSSLDEQYHPLADQKKLKFHVTVDDNVPDWVLGDPVRLRQIFANLLSNAVKFTESGSVSCTVSMASQSIDKEHQLVRFQIQDTGIGITEIGRALLFQPFRQLDPTITRKFGGTGLGLAIVQKLVEMMKGNITVNSHEGEGSCFIVELPLQKTEQVPDSLISPPLTITSRSVLVVEDNAFNRRLLEDMLTSWGQRVILAENGLQALQLMEQQRFDLVLLDIRMPDIDGIEVARRVRQREHSRSETPVPIIAITADADSVTREACIGTGINEVLAKPVIPEQLARAIAIHCEESADESFVEQLLLNDQTCSDLGTNPERARQYLEMLQQDIEDELQCLQTAMMSDDRTELVRAAHTLKGLLGHLANSEPAELAAWLQQNATSARSEQIRLVTDQLRISCQGRLAQEEIR